MAGAESVELHSLSSRRYYETSSPQQPPLVHMNQHFSKSAGFSQLANLKL